VQVQGRTVTPPLPLPSAPIRCLSLPLSRVGEEEEAMKWNEFQSSPGTLLPYNTHPASILLRDFLQIRITTKKKLTHKSFMTKEGHARRISEGRALTNGLPICYPILYRKNTVPTHGNCR
ncbi:hypothetical protein CEXT_593031, partial [Caerostris extrusa]